MSQRIGRGRRRELEELAQRIRLAGQLRGWSVHEIADEILDRLPELLRLEAYRLASGWTRVELSRAIDLLHREDGQAPPGISTSELAGWELGRHLPGRERQESLTRVYRTRPDRLGFGADHSPGAAAPRRWPPDEAARTAAWPLAAGAGLLQVGRAAVESLRETTELYRRQLPLLPPAALAEPVRAHLAYLNLLRSEAPPGLRRTLDALIADSHLLAGMLCFLSQNVGDALAHQRRARRLAAEIGDRGLDAQALIATSLLHLPTALAGRGTEVRVAGRLLNEAAESEPHLPAAARAQLAAKQAELEAVVGDAERCWRALARAQAAASEIDPAGPASCFGGWADDANRLGYEGTCRLLLGDGGGAASVLVRALATAAPERVPLRLLRQADLGRARLQQGELEEGARLLAETFERASELDYELAMERVRVYRAAIDPDLDEPALRELDDRLDLA